MQKIFKGRGGNVITHTHIFPLHFDKDMLWMPALWSPVKREETVCTAIVCECAFVCTVCTLRGFVWKYHNSLFFAPLLSEGDKKCSPRVDYDNSYANYSHTALFLQARGFDQVTPTLAQPDYSLKLHRAPTRALAHLIWCFSAALQAVEGENSVSNESCYAVCPMWHTAGVPTIFAPAE